MSNIKNTILADIVWDDGVSMPVANAQNKEIEKLIQTKQSSVVALQTELAENEDRFCAVVEHLKNMRQELQQIQGLVNAREKEFQAEDHHLRLTQREKGHLKQQVVRLMKDMDELNINTKAYENEIFKQTQTMEKLKSQLNWDHKALDSWLEESAKKDEDAMTILKYSRQDECKIKELSHSVEMLIAARLLKKHQLNIVVTNTVTCQVELQKAGENFRPAHQQRTELLAQWENTIELMKKRDREMDLLSSKMIAAKRDTRRRNNILKNKSQQLEREQEQNIRAEKTISATERKCICIRRQLADTEHEQDQFENQTEMMRRTLDRMVLELDMARTSVSLVNREIVEKNHRLYQAKDLRKTLDEKLKVAVTSALSVGEGATEMDDMLMAEERKQEALFMELKLLEGLLCKSSTDLHLAKAEEKIMEVNINCSQNTIKNMASKIKHLDGDILKQQEILYNQNLILQMLEKRCFRMQGEQSSDEKVILEDEIRDLKRMLEYKNHTHSILITQLRILQDHLRKLSLNVSRCQTEKNHLMIKIDDCSLYNVSTEIELKSLIKMKQNLMVDYNLMKLESKKLSDLLNSQEDNILSLEMRKLQLDTALRERQQEITIHQEMLTAKIKFNEEKRQQVAVELYDKMSRIDKLKMRYQFMVVFMTPPEGGEETSQVYCLIKAAEDKEALQREGDDLDIRIRKAEKEIRALVNTLNLLNGRNSLCQQSFQKLTKSNAEMNIKHDLDEQMRAVIDKYRYKKRQVQELFDQIDVTDARLKSLSKDEHAVMTLVQDKKNRIKQLTKEIQDQRDKLMRAAKQNARYIREARSASKILEELPEEKDIKIREIRDINKMVMSLITSAAQLYPEMNQSVCLYLDEANLSSPNTRNNMSRKSSLTISTVQSEGTQDRSIDDTVSEEHGAISQSSVDPTEKQASLQQDIPTSDHSL